MNRARAFKSNAKPKSRKDWMRRHLSSLMDGVRCRDEDLVVELRRTLAKKEGMIFAKKSGF